MLASIVPVAHISFVGHLMLKIPDRDPARSNRLRCRHASFCQNRRQHSFFLWILYSSFLATVSYLPKSYQRSCSFFMCSYLLPVMGPALLLPRHQVKQVYLTANLFCFPLFFLFFHVAHTFWFLHFPLLLISFHVKRSSKPMSFLRSSPAILPSSMPHSTFLKSHTDWQNGTRGRRPLRDAHDVIAFTPFPLTIPPRSFATYLPAQHISLLRLPPVHKWFFRAQAKHQ